MNDWKPFRKPENTDKVVLQQARRQAEKQFLFSARSTMDYERNSNFTPKWRCPQCSRENECAVTSCIECSILRPKILNGDPDIDGFEGLARLIADKKVLHISMIPDYIYEEARRWDYEEEHPLSDYKFCITINGKDQWVSWEKAAQMLLEGARA